MPIHDWTRSVSGGFHCFHQAWTIEIYNALNSGLLPPGYYAYIDLKVEDGREPDVTTIRAVDLPPPGGPAVAERPRVRQTVVESESAPTRVKRTAYRFGTS